MKTFTKFIVVACVVLLSWWQVQLHSGQTIVSATLIATGLVAAWLTSRSQRAGYWLGVFLGAGYLAELIVRFGSQGIDLVQPLLLWAAALLGCAGALLWESRERRVERPLYERFPEP